MGQPVRSKESFEDLYERAARRSYLHFAGRLNDLEAARDLWAECWATAFSNWRRCRASNESEEEAWLFGIARRQLASYYRTGAIRRRALERLNWQAPTPSEADEEMARVELESLRAEFAGALEQLPVKRRRAVQLRVVAGLPYEQVAERLGCSEQAARANVSRGLRQLSGLLDQPFAELVRGEIT